jgi:threonine/homoserine efflux transporter RhtA
MTDRRQSYLALLAVIGIEFLVLVRDSVAGLDVLPVTAVIAAAFWGAGLYLQKRSDRGVATAADAPVDTFA